VFIFPLKKLVPFIFAMPLHQILINIFVFLHLYNRLRRDRDLASTAFLHISVSLYSFNQMMDCVDSSWRGPQFEFRPETGIPRSIFKCWGWVLNWVTIGFFHDHLTHRSYSSSYFSCILVEPTKKQTDLPLKAR
jgi:hypothetical protein